VGALDDILQRLEALPPEKLAEVSADVSKQTASHRWVPTIGPQCDAYFSAADVLLFGGEPGGGKSQLGLGLAFNEHKRTLILRRQYTDLGPA
jgi:hypothetical protein